MKGFIRRLVAAACLVGGLAGLAGCYGYKDVVDTCYPERYNYQAQQEVCEPLGTQINNGHILDQTIWNWYFEGGKARLTRAGEDKLLQLVRRRPYPDPVIYLATAHDISFVQEAPVETFLQAQEKLNRDRTEAIQKYLATQTAGRNLSFQIYWHDPTPPYASGSGVLRSVLGMNAAFQGSQGAGAGAQAPQGSGGPSGTTTP